MKKRVLQVAYHSLAKGGIQAVIMSIVRNLKSEYDFDIVLFSSKKEYYDDEFLNYGSVYRIPLREKENVIAKKMEYTYRWIVILFGIYRVLKRGNYDVIHCHNEIESGICNLAARLAGVRVRISHSHNSFPHRKVSFLRKFYEYLLKLLIKSNSNIRIGCSNKAKEYLFGSKDRNAIVINNAIDFNTFDVSKYRKQRDKSKISFVHIGRFSYQKNQLFLLEIFKLISNSWSNTELKLVGFGDDLGRIIERIRELDLEEKVTILSNDSNIPEVLANSDYMIFPSRYEGLGIVLLEAQVMGVKCFVSDAVPTEADLGLCKYLSLDDGADQWAHKIMHFIETDKDSNMVSYEIKQQYDIRNIVLKYKEIYEANI